MHARVVTGLFQLDKIDEGVSTFRDFVVPGAKAYPGFKGALMLTDPGTGKMIALTLWETEAEREATNTEFPKALARVAQALGGPPTRENYEVSVQV